MVASNGTVQHSKHVDLQNVSIIIAAVVGKCKLKLKVIVQYLQGGVQIAP